MTAELVRADPSQQEKWMEQCIWWTPARQSGEACIGGHRIPAIQVAEAVAGGYADDYEGPESGYGLTHTQIVLACAFVTQHLPMPGLYKKHKQRRWKQLSKAWTQWLEDNFEGMWHTDRTESVPFPPEVPY